MTVQLSYRQESPTNWAGRPLIQYWHSEEIPAEVAALMATFSNHNPHMQHLVFDETRAERFIARHFTVREVDAFRSCAVPAMQADYFRYCAVLALGGIYVDVDFHCLKPLDSLLESVDEGLLLGFCQRPTTAVRASQRERDGQAPTPAENLLNGFFLAKAAKHPMLGFALDLATENIERRLANAVHIVTGPWVFTMLYLLSRAGSFEAAQAKTTGTKLETLVNLLIGVIGDYDRLEAAFSRVRVAPLDTAWNWIGIPPRPSYKQGDNHWVNWQREGRSIFRHADTVPR